MVKDIQNNVYQLDIDSCFIEACLKYSKIFSLFCKFICIIYISEDTQQQQTSANKRKCREVLMNGRFLHLFYEKKSNGNFIFYLDLNRSFSLPNHSPIVDCDDRTY